MNLSWTVPGGTITGYNIFRGTLATGLSDTPLNSAPLSSGTTTYQDTDVVAGNTYYYVVQALDGATASPKSNVQSATVPNTATTTEIDLTGAFNRAGITVDGQPFSGGLDGHGNALSENLLASSSLGTTFDLGTAATAGVVQALGQTIGLPSGPFTELEVLATGVNGNQPNQTFTVHYTNGTSQTFSQSLSDWYTPQNYPGETTALVMDYRDRSNATVDFRDFNLYQYSFALNPAYPITSITLPNNGNVEVLAITAVD